MFKRQNRAIDKRVGESWRKPRGIDNKQRIGLRGTSALPKIGYGQEKEGRNSHPSGLKEKLVFTVKELQKGFAIRIGGSVGAKKKKVITAEAKKLGLKVLN